MKKTNIVVGIAASLALIGGSSIAFAQVNQHTQAQSNQVVQSQQQQMTKDQIHYEMLNSIDNFNSARGEFIYHSDSAGYEYTVNYQVQLGNNPKSKVKFTSNQVSQETTYDGNGTFLRLDNKQKKFEKFSTPQQNGIQKNSLKDQPAKSRYSKNDKGEKVFLRRTDPALMGIAATSVFPQDIALGFLEDYNKWNIVSEENIDGRDAVVIQGELNDYYQNKHKDKTFKLWVDKETGVLLQMEEYNDQNQATEYIRTKSIKVNDTLDSDEFKAIVPSDYSELPKIHQ